MLEQTWPCLQSHSSLCPRQILLQVQHCTHGFASVNGRIQPERLTFAPPLEGNHRWRGITAAKNMLKYLSTCTFRAGPPPIIRCCPTRGACLNAGRRPLAALNLQLMAMSVYRRLYRRSCPRCRAILRLSMADAAADAPRHRHVCIHACMRG
jgi:hypothetical protein